MGDKERYRENLLVLVILLLLVGLFFSRALLSIGTGLFFLLSSWGISFRKTKQVLSQNNYYWLLALLFLLPLMSGIWSTDQVEWWNRIQVKIPLLIIPWAFLVMPVLSKRAYYLISWCYIILVIVTSLYSVVLFANDASTFLQAYHKAGLLQVAFDNDHVRYSWAIVIALLLLVTLYKNKINSRIENLLCIFLITWLVFYLHLLAAKTGLITFYLGFYLYCIYCLLTAQRKWIPIVGAFLPVLLILIAYYCLPSFQHRLHYVVWDYQQYANGHFLPGSPDGSRVASWKAGLSIFSNHCWGGVGAGDLWQYMQSYYQQNFPLFTAHDRILPNQILVYAASMGLPGLVLILSIGLYPFCIKQERKNIIWICFHAGNLICLFTDIGLEGQYGVFLFSFFTSWFSVKNQASLLSQ